MRSHGFDDSSDDYLDGTFPDGPRRGGPRRGAKRRGARPPTDDEPTDQSAPGGHWSSWADAARGPEPYPSWLVTEAGAVDTDLGVLKTGKEADVHLVRRAVPGSEPGCLLAAKRYRSAEHRMFHRDAGYLEGRRVRRSREMRAMAGRTDFGRGLIAGQWAGTEFAALCRLWSIGAPVPYPAQHIGTELMLEFLGDSGGTAAPRLAQLRPDPDLLARLWEQVVEALRLLAGAGLAHGDLSGYNLLVHEERLVLIDLPQVVDLVANPLGGEFLWRDVRNISAWFAGRGLPARLADPNALMALLVREAF